MSRVIIAILMIFTIILSTFSVRASIGGGKICGSISMNDSYPLCEKNTLPHLIESIEDPIQILKNLPIVFTENLGQIENPEVSFYNTDGQIWFTDDGMFFDLREYDDTRGRGLGFRDQGGIRVIPQNCNSQNPNKSQIPTSTHQYKSIILKQEFVGANAVRPKGIERLSWNSNFFYGNDTSNWFTDVPNYNEVWFENIYDGIDIRYYATGMGLKYDIIVNPDADPEMIRIKYMGSKGIEIDNSGDLIINTKFGELHDSGLLIYQVHNGTRNTINGNFKILSESDFSFNIIDDYDKKKQLIIDPLLEFSTFLGSGSSDLGYGISVDKVGNAYVSGITYSSSFPTTPGVVDRSKASYYDSFVTKLNTNGTTLGFSTFIGGNHHDYCHDIEVDPKGNTFITGNTKSSDFPTTTNAYDTSKNGIYSPFVLKLNFNGSRVIYSTFVEGATNTNNDEARAIAIDSKGNAFVTGYTKSNDFDTTSAAFDTNHNGLFDGFAFKLNQTGQKLVYSTYIGGSNDDRCYGISVDTSGNVYLTGETSSNDFMNTTGAFDNYLNGSNDAFILKLNQSGKMVVYSTYIGGASYDYGYDIDIDSMGNAIITGETDSSDFPTTIGSEDRSHNGNFDCYIFKLNVTGQKPLYSTFIGGDSIDRGNSIVLDSTGNVYITGYTASSNFPITPDAYSNILNGYDVFLVKLMQGGSRTIYSTLFGGSLSDHGESIAVDSFGCAYVVGRVSSSNFPTTNYTYDTSYAGNWDAFIFKFSFRPKLGITSLSLLKDDMLTSTIYSKNGEYTFRIDLIHSGNYSNLTDVNLILDPTGVNIQLSWSHLSDQFTKSNDPGNYLILEPTSTVKNDLIRWSIQFNTTFNWNFPNMDGELISIRTSAGSKSLPTAWYNSTDFFRVETEVCFAGELLIKDENDQTLIDNDLIAGGSILNFTGLKVVYKNTTEVYLSDDIFNVSIRDELGNVWINSPGLGEGIYFKIKTPKITNYSGFKYTFAITEIPNKNILKNETILLRLDSENVTFSDVIPKQDSWQTKTDFQVGVNITDLGGGVVDAGSVEYSYSIDNGTTWSLWEPVVGLESETSVIARQVLVFKEGKNNRIMWRATDSVGNGPVESEEFRILVDTKEVEFNNYWPTYNEVSKTENVDFGITISDETSGVNALNIQYSTSFDKGSSWSDWINIGGSDGLEVIEDGAKIMIHINATFPNGTDNMLRWRAWDIAGNGPAISKPYLINVNTWVQVVKPITILVSPPTGLKINTTNVTLVWELEDANFPEVVYDIYFAESSPPVLYQENIEETKFNLTDLEDGTTYYWKIIPRDGKVNGTCRSGIWWFEIDLEEIEAEIPEEHINITITGPKEISIYPTEKKRIELLITNNDKTDHIIKLKLETGEMLRYILLDDDSDINLSSQKTVTRNLDLNIPIATEQGKYYIIVKILSDELPDLELAKHEIAVEIKDIQGLIVNKTDPSVNENNKNNDTKDSEGQTFNDILIFSIITIVILTILVIMGYGLILNRRKKGEEKLQTLGIQAQTIKPRVQQTEILTSDQQAAIPGTIHTPKPNLTQLTTSGTIPNVHQQIQSIRKVMPQIGMPTPVQSSSDDPQPASTVQPQAPITKKDDKLQIPQIMDKPKLPPANEDTIKVTEK